VSEHLAAISTQNTLRKLSAHLRWQIEKCGVAPETVKVVIVVGNEIERSRMISGFLRDFDPEIMTRDDRFPGAVTLSGVPVHVAVKTE